MVEVGQSVELNRLVSPLALNARAKLGGEASWLADVSADDLLILIHGRDPLTVRQQKGLSGLWQHPKGRITTSNPGLLGCSAPGGVTAENRRSGAHFAHQGEDARSGDADESDDVAVYHFRFEFPLRDGGASGPKIGGVHERGKMRCDVVSWRLRE
jgi:hypothetical protein